MREEKIALIEDTPTPDIALPIDIEQEITNPLVKSTYDKLGPFNWEKQIPTEFKNCRALQPYVKFENNILTNIIEGV